MAVNDCKSDHFKAWVSKISAQVDLYTILKAAWYGALQVTHVNPKQLLENGLQSSKLVATLLFQTTVNGQDS